MFDLSKLPPYALIDSGNNKKLEKFGDKLIIRASKSAIWEPRLGKEVWNKASAEYTPETKKWHILKPSDKNLESDSWLYINKISRSIFDCKKTDK